MAMTNVKAPAKSPIPKQHSANAMHSQDATPDEIAETLMSTLCSLNHVIIVRAPLHLLNTFKSVLEHLVIIDSGADSHVAGKAWLLLFDPDGPCVPCVNVIGHNEHTTQQHRLPLVPCV